MAAKPKRTSPETMAYILDQLGAAGDVRARKMFGEYGVYCGDRFIGVVCADQLFIKPTPAGAALEPDLGRAPPYEGAKPSVVISPDMLEDPDRLAAFVRATADALPPQKPRRKKKAVS
ncbi:MAG: TfoX/Sxy family protein [Pseudomonadota bacterium]